MEMNFSHIIDLLPFEEPFLFVDEIEWVSEKGVRGNCTFSKNNFFYKGHFKDNPITPGVILTECMAQIGVVVLGIFLLKKQFENDKNILPKIAMTYTKIDFYIPVLPEEKVTVVSEKIYFRFNKLKCAVKMYNEQKKLVCKGEISGMFKTDKK